MGGKVVDVGMGGFEARAQNLLADRRAKDDGTMFNASCCCSDDVDGSFELISDGGQTDLHGGFGEA